MLHTFETFYLNIQTIIGVMNESGSTTRMHWKFITIEVPLNIKRFLNFSKDLQPEIILQMKLL